jgi:hypothetical protein
MSSLQSPKIRIASRKHQTEKSPATLSSSLNAGDYLSPPFMNTANLEMLNRFDQRFRLSGIDISLDEFSEHKTFFEFLAHHVQPNRICDVQCMRLWSEWVRTFQRRKNGFPRQILEKEFSSTVRDVYGVPIAVDGFRGAIFPGIQFVP